MSSSSRIMKLLSSAAIIQISDGAACTIPLPLKPLPVAWILFDCSALEGAVCFIELENMVLRWRATPAQWGPVAKPNQVGPESPQAWVGCTVSIAAWPAISVPCQVSLEVTLILSPTCSQPSYVRREPRRRQSSRGKGQALFCLYSWRFHESSIKALDLWKRTGFKAREVA